jgi:diguanylate cyclase (GGDEF)-like protein
MSGSNPRTGRARVPRDAPLRVDEASTRTDHVACANESPQRNAMSSHRRQAPEGLQTDLLALASIKKKLEAALRDNDRLNAENRSLTRDLAAASRRGIEAHHLAYHDVLTGLPNRLMLMQRLQRAILEAHELQRQLALLFIDLDHFKLVNDRLGHPIGDRVLTVVASRLLATIRTSDIACRYGGDEFVVLLPDIADSAVVGAVVEKMRVHLEDPYGIDGNDVHIKASIGFALYPSHGDHYDALLSHADASMYEAKAARSRRGADDAVSMSDHSNPHPPIPQTR